MADKSQFDSIAARLREVVERSGLTDYAFAESIGMDRSQFGRVLRGKLNITLKQVLDISSLYGVRAGWIVDGIGNRDQKETGLTGPDRDLLTQVKNEAEAAILSLHKLIEALPVADPREEDSDQGGAYAPLLPGNTLKADKPLDNASRGKDKSHI